MTLAELIIVSALSLLVLTMAGTMFATMTTHSVATTNKIEAEIKIRQSLDRSMRYLRNSAPLAYCSQWSGKTSSINKNVASDMDKCLRFTSLKMPIPSDSTVDVSQFTVYAYSDASGIGSGQAPDKITFTVDAAGTLTITRYVTPPSTSIIAAYCADQPGSDGCTGVTPAVWTLSSVIASIQVANPAAFTYLSDSGTPTFTPSNIRTVLIDLSAKYRDSKRSEQRLTYTASASLRGAQYQADQK